MLLCTQGGQHAQRAMSRFGPPLLHSATGLTRRWLVACALFLLAARPLSARPWSYQPVHWSVVFMKMSDRSLRIDNGGRPHLVYGRFYSYHDGESWHRETFDEVSVRVGHTALAVDDLNRPHISYRDVENEDAAYAYKDGDTWHRETIESQGDAGFHTSIALDGQGRPHVSYRAVETGTLKYAFRDQGGWQVEVADVDTHQWSGYYTSLALDASGYPHIAFFRDWFVSYAYKDSTGWHTETVEPEDYLAGFASIALDLFGTPYMSYWDADDGGLMCATRNESGWTTETVDSGDVLGGGNYNSIAVDSSGVPHIAFLAHSDGWVLGYARKEGADWHLEIADSAEPTRTTGELASLALDAAGSPRMICVSYQSGDEYRASGELRYICPSASGWTKQTVDREGFVEDCSIVSTPFGYTRMCYVYRRPWYRTDLIYVYEDRQGWHYETVGEVADYPPYTFEQPTASLALDGALRPHISFYGNDALYHAYQDELGWHVEPVDSEGYHFSSMAVDSSGVPHIGYVYHYWSSHTLKHARADTSGWYIAEVNNDACLASMALSATGYPHFAYATMPKMGLGDTLKYAYLDSSGWHEESVDTAGYGHIAPVRPCMGIGPTGRPHISYWEIGALKHAYRDEAGWHAEGVAPASWTMGSSMKLDGLDRPHIAYEYGGLRYACYDGTSWRIETVDGDCYGLSLSLDQLGRPHIGYVRGSDLWIASSEPLDVLHGGSGIASLPGVWLLSVTPNPVTSWVAVRYALEANDRGSIGRVTLRLYDMAGHLAATFLTTGDAQVGQRSFLFGPSVVSSLAPGVYVLRLEAGTPPAIDTKHVVILR